VVYVCGQSTLVYYFRRHGIEEIGDWIGPGRFADFDAAVVAGHLENYAGSFGIGAFLISKQAMNAICRPPGFEQQAAAAGFHRVSRPNWILDAYVR
jgi:hypothetical protein